VEPAGKQAVFPLFAMLLIGCGAAKENASFDVSIPRAQEILHDMRASPKPLERPLVVLSGFCDPGIAAGHLRGEFRRLTGDQRVVGVSFLFCGDFDACRKSVIDAVERKFPSDDPRWTTEVDVVGVSMGGLVGRYAAVPRNNDPNAKRLKIARLFTISSPHRGAAMAGAPALHRLHQDMRQDSPFLRHLAEMESRANVHTYDIFPYVRLGDAIVGAENAAPAGRTPWWVSAQPLQDSHLMAMMDARIIADVARRLRGEEPLTHEPPQPLPSVTPRPGASLPQASCEQDHGTTFASR
jgi:pimeloyl-ACP methyl ester carboxylesterase